MEIRHWYFLFPDRIEVWEGEVRDLPHHFETKGPFLSVEEAVEFRWRDSILSYWERGLSVIADHCLKCGKWAKVLAADWSAGWAWRVTDCKFCGVVDERLLDYPFNADPVPAQLETYWKGK